MGFGLLAVIGAAVLMALQSVMEDVPEPGEEVIEDGDSIAGSDYDDVINGDASAQMIMPHSGDDLVNAGGGDDFVSDFPWDQDNVSTPAGLVNPDWDDDTINGEGGNDRILATGGANLVDGGAGNDTVSTVDLHPDAPFAPDRVSGGGGADWLIGDDGDTLSGNGATDFFTAIVDEPQDDVVTITDFDRGETLEILIYDPSLLNPDGSAPEADLRDTQDGVVVSVAGQDAVIFANSLARDLNGTIRVLDGLSL